jgi:hypothetical protein
LSEWRPGDLETLETLLLPGSRKALDGTWKGIRKVEKTGFVLDIDVLLTGQQDGACEGGMPEARACSPLVGHVVPPVTSIS